MTTYKQTFTFDDGSIFTCETDFKLDFDDIAKSRTVTISMEEVKKRVFINMSHLRSITEEIVEESKNE